MYCTFYRPATINHNEFQNIVGKLAYDLHLLTNTQQDNEWGAYSYFYHLSRYVTPVEHGSSMSVLGLADPAAMPSDARVEYVYRPTYIATAIMMKSVLMYPSLMNEADFLDSELDFTVDTVKSTLASCMKGCTGRGFDGAGVLSLEDCIDIFERAGADEFLEQYPELCPEFAELYHKMKKIVNR